MSRWKQVTPRLLFCCFCLLVGDLLFGYDTGSFGGLLANPVCLRTSHLLFSLILVQGFLRDFGEVNADGAYAFRPLIQSLLSSLAFIGKFLGCLLAGPLIERWGHRKIFAVLSVTSFLGIAGKYCRC